MLRLSPADLQELSVEDFLDQVEGCLLWESTKQESLTEGLLDWLSWFTANVMLSSGNYKKGTDPLTLKKGLFQTAQERAEETVEAETFEDSKAKLLKRFDLSE